jgi:hypothetical protein
MRIVLSFLLLASLWSCAAGPVFVARTQEESIKTRYEDAQLKKLYTENEAFLRDLYSRLNKANVHLYKEGLGLTLLTDQKNEKLHYIMVNLRPAEIYFNEATTKPEQRFAYVLQTYFPKYLNYIKKEDLDRNDIEGLAIGIYWPVRDYSQCDTYGGFIEYIHIYLSREDVWDYLDNKMTFEEAVQNSEVITSLNLQPAKNVRPVFQ